MKEENIKVVESYLNAIKQKDLSLARLADDLRFEDPMMKKGLGADNLRAFLTGFLPAVNVYSNHPTYLRGRNRRTH